MSAGIDLTNEFTVLPSIQDTAGTFSGTPASGEIVGMIADLRDSDMLTHAIISFQGGTSGQFKIQVQTAADTNSGSFTDPTSGLQRMPTNLLSGGIIVVNSGNNQPSGGMFFGGFFRPADHRYCRGRLLSGDVNNGLVNVSMGAWSKRTGSGAGYTFSPSSGVVGGF